MLSTGAAPLTAATPVAIPLAGWGLRSVAVGEPDLPDAEELVAARLEQLESREQELLALVQNQEQMLR